jgi:cell division protein FtsB
MDVFTMVVIIVVVSCGAGVVNNYLKTRRQELRGGAGADVQAEIEALKQRIAALEAIVTDDRYHLQRELDQLERQG